MYPISYNWLKEFMDRQELITYRYSKYFRVSKQGNNFLIFNIF